MFGLGCSKLLVYERNHATLKKFNNHHYKVTFMRSCRLPGFEERGACKGKRNSVGYSSKLDASLSRTRSRIFELAMCNPWQYFVTLTLAPENGNRCDLGAFQRRLSKWLNNLRVRNGWDIRYLLIPELHKDGVSWHMHGFIMGLPESCLVPFTLDQHIPYDIRNALLAGRQVFNWPAYQARFGFVRIDPIRDLEATAKYSTKYITKDLSENIGRLNKKLYLCSHGLKRAQIIYRGQLSNEFKPDFHNDYVAVKTFHSLEDAISLFVDDEPASTAYGFFDESVEASVPVSFLDMLERLKGGVKTWKPCCQA